MCIPTLNIVNFLINFSFLTATYFLNARYSPFVLNAVKPHSINQLITDVQLSHFSYLYSVDLFCYYFSFHCFLPLFLLLQKLASSYEILSRAYNNVVDVMQSGKRMLGKYFRVAFFGQAYFGDEDGKQYVYKEPKITGLTEICERLNKIYSDKHGRDKICLIRNSNKV